ncbi:MAG: DUF502 domain-containing protein [Bacteroidota bacterium]
MEKYNYSYFFRKFLAYFLQGLFYIAPIGVTVFIIYRVFIFFDNILPLKIPGLGILIIIVSIGIVGFLGGIFIKKPIATLLERYINKAPIVKIIYSSVKDLLGAFVGKKKRFDKPVLVKLYNNSELQKIGFITQQDLSSLGIGKTKVAVYFPHSYNFSGNLLIIPVESITPLEASSADIMRFIVSGGVTEITLQEEKNEDES